MNVSIDTTTESFARDVLAASRERPVVVDFWAPWCAPCRTLKPTLEKLAREYGGKFVLAKLNTDEHPDVAQQFAVRGIPNVKAFVDGQVVDEFTGALPESGVRAFLDRVVPSPAEVLRRAASADVAAGDFDAAEAKLREALVLAPENGKVRVELAELLAARPDYPGAEILIEPLGDATGDDRLERLRARIAGWRAAQTLPSLPELRERLARQPENAATQLQLAERLVVEGDLRAAMEAYIEVVGRDRGALREQARQGLLRSFSLAADDADLVRDFRRRLASLLN